MSIRMVRDQHGVIHPQVFCDVCGKRIERARGGNYLWDREASDVEGASTDVKFAHKDCTRLADRLGEGRQFAANELSMFPGALWRQLDMSDRDAVYEIESRRGDDPLAAS